MREPIRVALQPTLRVSGRCRPAVVDENVLPARGGHPSSDERPGARENHGLVAEIMECPVTAIAWGAYSYTRVLQLRHPA